MVLSTDPAHSLADSFDVPLGAVGTPVADGLWAAGAVSAPARLSSARLDGVRALLTDGRSASVRLVVNPERMVIAEARRTYTYLSLFGYRVDAVIANRLLPDEVTDPWFDAWK